MLPVSIQQKCEEIIGAEILGVQTVSGGDINQAMKLETREGLFFLKINTDPFSGAMFEAEAEGLALLAATKCIQTPEVQGFGMTVEGGFLLLEHFNISYRPTGFWEKFGAALAELHRNSAINFGLGNDNFIGSLPQSNCLHDTWSDFFKNERLQPQLEIAKQKNKLQPTDIQGFEKFCKRLPDICPVEPPALIHGDLWSGNFLCSADGQPVLVDPSVSYSHREMDLAMTRLFGGFDQPFYRSYEEAWPLASGFEQRLPIYQLYYLLVHVNLFGGSYVGSVRSILKQFI
ncbi:MAG: fructosamine kinase family protein [Saprospiraceae bacterium]|nr:fructosamine kinase family protein [Saprospiraceae bacterium]MCF8251649.1 fructosamine kinase family protein [Saprospiraceae bacterium]MCF8281059.1 fructosamine kinase family protein [Bacteroidales bacterium]MCF8313268.1 fructosamine kinase family protein [Saprospiraceae bacterium]MCF8442012.1 fructosamine kinase family protein [Saprospiraceae bacterium]